MTKRLILDPKAISKDLYKKILMLSDKKVQEIVCRLVGEAKTRRKPKKDSFEFTAHPTEYLFYSFFNDSDVDGIFDSQMIINDQNQKTLSNLVALSNILGHKTTDEKMLAALRGCRGTSLAQGVFVELIPEVVYAYTSKFQRGLLVLKLEYFFGATVIDVLDVNSISVNMGTPRANIARAKLHANIRLAQAREALANLD